MPNDKAIIRLLGYLLENHGFVEHPRGEERAKTFLDDLKSHGYVIEPDWSYDMDAAPRDWTPADCYDGVTVFVAWRQSGGLWLTEEIGVPNPQPICWRPRPKPPQESEN